MSTDEESSQCSVDSSETEVLSSGAEQAIQDLRYSIDTPYEPVRGDDQPVDLEQGARSVVEKETGRGKRAYFFTWNNPGKSYDVLCIILQHVPDIRYFIFQYEVGENGTPHYQGYLQLNKPKLMRTLQNWLQKSDVFMHFQVVDDNVAECIKYCSKEETRHAGPWTWGTAVYPRQRSDLKRVAERVVEGEPLEKLARSEPGVFTRYHSGLYALSRYAKPPPDERPIYNQLFIGPPGCGKTHKGMTENPERFVKMADKWWDGYHGQKCVLWDDFAGAASKMPLTLLLQVLDKYQSRVETKGATEWMLSEKNVVTTNVHPYNWYGWVGRRDHLTALARRFHEVVIWKLTDTAHVPSMILKDPAEIRQFFEDPQHYGYEAIDVSARKSFE